MANDHPWWTDTENGKEEVLNLDLIKRGLNSSLFGVNIVYHTALGSTNDLAKDLALRGAPEGTVVVTEEQTAGKGRRRSCWHQRTNLLLDSA
jgi:BirA family biotin operon repressor/biotin-[acetyl-CoA-carboxylase] ligase